MSRRLVLTADDVGVDPRTTDTVARLVADGRLTAASVIPMAPSAAQAVAALAGHAAPGAGRSLSLGLHATFTAGPAGRPWAPLTGAASLRRPGAQAFHDDVSAFAAAADPGDVLAELRAQVDWFADVGAQPSHLDSHHGALYGIDGPHFLEQAVRVCAVRGLVLRLPRVVPAALGVLRPGVREVHRGAVELADAFGVPLPETIGTEWRPLAELSGYADLRDSYIALLRALPEGLSEIFLHPSAEPGPRGGEPDGLLKRVWERRLLEDDAFSDVLAAEGIEVVPWPVARATAAGTGATSRG